MTSLEKMLHNWNETTDKINNKIDNILPTITAASTASAIDRKSVVFSGTGKALESLKVSGRTVQDGTPTPDAPVEVKGVGDEANLFNIDDVIRDDTYYLNDDGVEINDGNSGHIKNFIKINPNNTCTIMSTSTATFRVYFYDVNKQWLGRSSSNSAKYVFKRSDVYYIQIQYLIASSTLFLNGLEIYNGIYKIPVSCGGETTNIYLDSPVFEGESVDLVDGIKNKKWISVTIETIIEDDWVYVDDESNPWINRVYLDTTKSGTTPIIKTNYSADCIPMCNYFQGQAPLGKGDSTKDAHINFGISGINSSPTGMIRFGLYSSGIKSVSEFKTWLEARAAEGKPLTIWYETTGVTTETFDTSPIPTTSGNNELTINTEVIPATIDVTTFGDYYSKVEVDKMIGEVNSAIDKHLGNKFTGTAKTGATGNFQLGLSADEYVVSFAYANGYVVTPFISSNEWFVKVLTLNNELANGVTINLEYVYARR